MLTAPILGLFAVALVELVLALVVLVKAPRRPVNCWFAAFATALAAWGTLVGVRRSLGDPAAILTAVRVLYAGASLIPVTFLQFAQVFPRPAPTRMRLTQAITLLGLFFSGLAFSPWIVAEVQQTRSDYFQPAYGPMYPLFAVYVIACTAWALAHLAQKLRYATGFARAQLQYLFFGAGLTALGTTTLGLVVPIVTGTSRFGVYGPFFTLIWLGFTAHSIIRHRLMDIRVVISRTVAYATTWALTAGLLVGGGSSSTRSSRGRI